MYVGMFGTFKAENYKTYERKCIVRMGKKDDCVDKSAINLIKDYKMEEKSCVG